MVGLPLTLRGEHGLQAAGDGRVRRGAARARSTCRSRPTTSGSPRCWPTATTRARPRTCSRATWNGGAAEPLSIAAGDRSGAGGSIAVADRAARRRGRGVRRRLRRDAAAAPQPPPPPPPPPPPKPFRIVFPEGFTREQMADRVVAVAEIARRKRNANVRLNRTAYLRRERARASCRASAASRSTNLEGFLFPATYEFLRDTTSRRLVLDQIETFCRNWRKVDLRYARSKNLTPYDVLIDRVDDREGGRASPSERKLVAAVIYNRLRNRMTLGIDATLRYGLTSRRRSRSASRSSQTRRRTTRAIAPGLPPTPIANPGLASIQAAAHPAKVDYLYFARKPDQRAPLLHRERVGVLAVPARERLRLTDDAHVALLGHPVSHSLSPLMQNAAFAAARARLALLGLRRRGRGRGGARAADARLRGRERDDPAQAGRRRRVRRGRGRGREHARLPRRPRARLQHRPRDPRRDRGDARVRDRRGRRGADARAGAARRHARLLAQRRLAARRRGLRPDRERDARARRAARAAARRADRRRPRLRARQRRDGARRGGARGGLRGDRRPRGARPPGREELRALDRRAGAGATSCATPFGLRSRL